MMKLPLKSIRRALCAGVLLPVILGGGTEYVLCRGEDGRLAIEATSDGRCIPALETDRCGEGLLQEERGVESLQQCRSCTDLPLTVKGPFIHAGGGQLKRAGGEDLCPAAGMSANRLPDFGTGEVVIFSAAPPPDLPVFSVLRSPIIRV